MMTYLDIYNNNNNYDLITVRSDFTTFVHFRPSKHPGYANSLPVLDVGHVVTIDP